jgi:prevent-host-death family protein
MKLSRAVKSISYLKQHTAEAVNGVRDSTGPLVITQNGEAKAVLVDIAEFEQAQESFALLKMLADVRKQLKAGRG